MNQDKWESELIEALAEKMEISISDAQGFYDANGFYATQAFGLGLNPKESADFIMGKIFLKKFNEMLRYEMVS